MILFPIIERQADLVDLGSPVLDVAPSVRGALLQTLARLEQPVTRRQLAAAAGVAPGNASGVIEELIQNGLVSEMVAGRSSMVMLNRNHLAAGLVLALAGLRGELIRRLRERLSEWSDLRGAWLFGSVARGDADNNSDVDLLIVVDDLQSPDLHERLSRLQADVRSWTGNDLQLVEHSPSSWRKLVRAKNPLFSRSGWTGSHWPATLPHCWSATDESRQGRPQAVRRAAGAATACRRTPVPGSGRTVRQGPDRARGRRKYAAPTGSVLPGGHPKEVNG